MTKTQLAKSLLNIGAVHLDPVNQFTWASGIQSPIYCDNRKILSFPKLRKEVASLLATKIQEKWNDFEVIAGTATAGIAHAAWVSDILNVPMVYVRSKAKGHGMTNAIEGVIPENKKCVVIEDLISTGMSSFAAIEKLREVNADCIGLISIFQYGTKKSIQLFEKKGVEVESLLDAKTLLDVALNEKIITGAQREEITEFLYAL